METNKTNLLNNGYFEGGIFKTCKMEAIPIEFTRIVNTVNKMCRNMQVFTYNNELKVVRNAETDIDIEMVEGSFYVSQGIQIFAFDSYIEACAKASSLYLKNY